MKLSLSQSHSAAATQRLLRLKDFGRFGDVEVFFELPGQELPPPANLDGFVFGIILAAMQVGKPLHIDGPMSSDALCNLNEFQEAWAMWRPNRYRKIDVTCSHVVSVTQPKERQALVAFSGGVDSIFTLLRHGKPLLGAAALPVRSAVMVQGFDVALPDADGFARLQARTRPLLDDLGVNLLTVRTNLKALDLQGWDDSSMPQLAACLHNFSHRFDSALVGSTEPYDGLILPWGSNPATDHLLSGAAMRLVHDGAGYTRTHKVAEIARHGTATRVLKVCWEGADSASNCGRCEKCVRTQLNFLAAGVSAPACFEGVLDLDLIEGIKISSPVQMPELVSIARYARAQAATGAWFDHLERRIASFRPPSKAQVLLGKLQRLIGVLLKGDVKEFVRRIRKQIG